MNQGKSQIKLGIILSYINIFVGNIIPIFYTPIMLSILGQSEYGLYKLASSVTSYLSLISFGIGSAVTRYLIKAREEGGREAEERVLGLFMIIFQIIAVLSLIVGIVLTLNLDIWYGDSLDLTQLHTMRVLVFLMVCNMALNFSMSPYISVVSSHERFVFLQCTNIITTCLAPCLNLVALFLGYASIGMTAMSLILTLIVRFMYTIYLRRYMCIKPRYTNLPTKMLKEILTFSFWIFVGNVVGQLYNATDTVMIGAVPALATIGVAVYNVGSTFNSIMLSLTTAISNLLSPKINKMVFAGASNTELNDLSIRVGRLQSYIMLLIISGFISFGQPFITFYAGEDYMEAFWVAILMMVPNIIPLSQSAFLAILTAKNRHQFRAVMYLVIAIVNVIGTWLLLEPMGIIGAALMTGIALILGQGIMMNIYYKVKLDMDIVRFWKETGCTFIVPIVLCIITLLISSIIDFYNLKNLLLGIVVYTLIYCALSWRFIMNQYEKSLVFEIIKIKRRG